MNVNKEVADAIRVIQGDAAVKLESLKKSYTLQGVALNVLARQQEILFDISYHFGWRFSRMDEIVFDSLQEDIGGSRNAFQQFKDWTVEFDTMWESGGHRDDDQDYMSAIDKFCDEKYATLLAIHRLDSK